MALRNNCNIHALCNLSVASPFLFCFVLLWARRRERELGGVVWSGDSGVGGPR